MSVWPYYIMLKLKNQTKIFYGNMAFSRYNVLDYWSVGEVYKRLIKDISDEYADNLIEIYNSWIGYTFLTIIRISITNPRNTFSDIIGKAKSSHK